MSPYMPNTVIAANTSIRLIQQIVVGVDGQAEIDFQSIPQTYAALRIVCAWRNEADVLATTGLRFNGDTAANYRTLIGGSEETGATSINFAFISASSSPWSTYVITDIPFSAGTALLKQTIGTFALIDSDDLGARTDVSGFWNSAAAINRVTLFIRAGTDFQAGSIVNLYGSV